MQAGNTQLFNDNLNSNDAPFTFRNYNS